jgi:hypothetical protein
LFTNPTSLKEGINPTSLEEGAIGPFVIQQVHVNGTLTILCTDDVYERIDIRQVNPYHRYATTSLLKKSILVRSSLSIFPFNTRDSLSTYLTPATVLWEQIMGTMFFSQIMFDLVESEHPIHMAEQFS